MDLSVWPLRSYLLVRLNLELFQKTNPIFNDHSISDFFAGISFFNLIKVLSLPVFALTATADMLKWIFLSFPHYALGSSLFNMNQAKILSEVCHIQCERLARTWINLEFGLKFVIPIPRRLKEYAHLIPELLKEYSGFINIDAIIQDVREYAGWIHNATSTDLTVLHNILEELNSYVNVTQVDGILQAIKNYVGSIQIDTLPQHFANHANFSIPHEMGNNFTNFENIFYEIDGLNNSTNEVIISPQFGDYNNLTDVGTLLQQIKHYAHLIHKNPILQEIGNFPGHIHIDPSINGSNLNLLVKWNDSFQIRCDPNKLCSEYFVHRK